MKKIILMLLLVAQSCVFAFENSYDEALTKLEDGIRNTDVAVVRECLNEMHVREVDMPRILEFAQGIVDLRRIDVQAIADPQAKYLQTPPSAKLWLHVSLCLGSLIGGFSLIPITIVTMNKLNVPNHVQNTYGPISVAVAVPLILFGIYKIFNINTRIKNAILQRYVDALSIKQLLYKIEVTE